MGKGGERFVENGPVKRRLKGLAPVGLCLLMGFGLVHFFAEGTSLLRRDAYCWDSGLFQTIGMLWADGMIPYRDVFDHKGPLLFLIQRAAYAFADPQLALYLLESLFVSVSLYLCYQILRLWAAALPAMAGMALCALFWLPVLEYGNLSEEYSLPFVLLALYLQLRWLGRERQAHPWPYALTYGLCFGSTLMIRPNNGVLISAITAVITVALALRGQWKSILVNALALLAGVLLAVLPFVAYFAAHGALKDFFYGTWTFNLQYAAFTGDLQGESWRGIVFFTTPALLCLGAGAGCLLRRRWLMAAMQLAGAVSTMAVTLTGAYYAHYFMLYLPLIPLALCGLGCLGGEGRGWRGLAAAGLAVFVLTTVRTSVPIAARTCLKPRTAAEAMQTEAYNEALRAFVNCIPQEERGSVAVCGLGSGDVALFLQTELRPAGRYLFLMEWHAQTEGDILSQYLRFLDSREAGWLVLREGVVSDTLLEGIERNYAPGTRCEAGGAVYRLYQARPPV